MIELNAPHPTGRDRRIVIFGIGGAGGNALDRLALDGVNPAQLIAVNTDAAALHASVAETRLQLGEQATRGVGCGGDPELGRVSAEGAYPHLRDLMAGADVVFLLAGLGGGTGSGATPIVAEAAREAGATTIAVVTLPFGFEGKRRGEQAAEALVALQTQADAVVCFENDRMASLVSPKASAQQAFAAADQMISQSVQAIAALLGRRGLIQLGFDDFRAALVPSGGLNPRCVFGYGEASGDNRLYEALEMALRSPFLDKGRLLEECATVLVHVSGGPETTLNEVQLLMETVNRQIEDRTRLLFGLSVAPELAGRLSITIVSSIVGDSELVAAAPAAPATRIPTPQPVPAAAWEPTPAPSFTEAPAPVLALEPEETPEPSFADPTSDAETESASTETSLPDETEAPAALDQRSLFDAPAKSGSASAPPAVHRTPRPPRPPAPKAPNFSEPEAPASAPKVPQQESLPFEPVSRGRFDKSEPTIVDGQDLDVPTFLRQNIRIR
jgi:cell division protein FtsZ